MAFEVKTENRMKIKQCVRGMDLALISRTIRILQSGSD